MSSKTQSHAIDNEAIAATVNGDQAPKDFPVSLSKARLQEIERGLLAEAEIDLEEHAPQPVNVSCRETREVDLTDDEGIVILGKDGKPRKRLEEYYRTAKISTFVPVELLIETILLKKQLEVQGKDRDEAALVRFQTEQVLKIWKLTEPEMTYEDLTKILDFPKVRGLFGRFFKNLKGGNPPKK